MHQEFKQLRGEWKSGGWLTKGQVLNAEDQHRVVGRLLSPYVSESPAMLRVAPTKLPDPVIQIVQAVGGAYRITTLSKTQYPYVCNYGDTESDALGWAAEQLSMVDPVDKHAGGEV